MVLVRSLDDPLLQGLDKVYGSRVNMPGSMQSIDWLIANYSAIVIVTDVR